MAATVIAGRLVAVLPADGTAVTLPDTRLALSSPQSGVVSAVGVTADSWRVERRANEVAFFCDAPAKPARVVPRQVVMPDGALVEVPVGARLHSFEWRGVTTIRVHRGVPSRLRVVARWLRGWRYEFAERRTP
jgi:hypothetical protein